jgi:hypothetical protein
MSAARTTTHLTGLAVLGLLTAGVVFANPSGSEIKRAFGSGDRDRVLGILGELEGELDQRGVRAVLDGATDVKQLGVYDELVATLATAEGDALEELAKQATRHRRADVRFLCVDALADVSDALAGETLLEVLEEDRDESVAVVAARRLARRGTAPTVEGLIALLEEWEDNDRKARLVREINSALVSVTEQELSVAQDWRNWWEGHKNAYSPPDALAEGGATRTRDEDVMDRLRRERPGDLATVTRLRDDEIIVIRGSSDRVEEVLEALELEHQRHDRDEFDSVELDPERQVLILNCGGRTELSAAGIAKVRDFVGRGGYLFTSDWELRNTLEKAFPEAIHFATESPREDRQITIVPHPQGGQHPLLRDVFPLSTWTEREFAWQLDSRSQLARPGGTYVPLVISHDMDSMASNVVCLTFSFTSQGGGRPVTGASSRDRARARAGQVLHVLSHFKNQGDSSGDGFALQQLLLNFIVEKQEQRRLQLQGDR